MATQQLNPALRPPAHPMANPGYGKRLAPSQSPRRADDFAHLPRREAEVADYIDRQAEGADISVKTLAKHVPGYGQCAMGTILKSLSAAGHYRRIRQCVTSESGTNHWVWRSYWSRTARDDAWWARFAAGELGASTIPASLARSAAYDLLARLGRIEAGLTLSAPECAALEAAAGVWFERGASETQLLSALTAGLPAHVSHPYGFVRRRLLDKLPPEPPAPRMVMECTECGVPGDPAFLPGGLCRACTGPGTTAHELLPPGRVHDHVDQLRAALRTSERNET
ncbi:hypothetical protein OHS70_14605 [Streptomyces sp. NBC_00390]|uniref:hypothetical protein n=1 Tax=Streptomyces sp. NBC_00390 TaxID=2975736 RepID=UPI002E1B89D6